LFHIDILTQDQESVLYLLSPSKEGVSLTFNWLKHDLLNILNPIMGFTDLMSHDDKYDEEDQQILMKINENTRQMFQQFKRIAQAEKIFSLVDLSQRGNYHLKHYVSELIDKLKIDHKHEEEIEINIDRCYLVTDYISQQLYRSVLEDLLSFFYLHKGAPPLIVQTQKEDQNVQIRFHFPHCQISAQVIKSFAQVEHFVLGKQPIKKLQMPSLNYLLLCEQTKLIGGEVLIENKKDKISLILILPIDKIESTTIKTSPNPHTGLKLPLQTKERNHLPDDLKHEINDLWDGFDGMMILDRWEVLCQEMIEINKTYQNKELEKHIQKLSHAISSFDIDTLKQIHHHFRTIFE